MPVPVSPARQRLYRGLSDPPRHHDRTAPAPHISPQCPRRKNCRRGPTRRAGGVERRLPRDGSLAPREGSGSAVKEGFPNNSGAVSLPGSPPHYLQHNCRHTNFKIDRLHTKYKIKYSTLISRLKQKKSEKNRQNVKIWISETRVRIEKTVKSERDNRSHTKSKIKGPPTQISRQKKNMSTLISR